MNLRRGEGTPPYAQPGKGIVGRPAHRPPRRFASAESCRVVEDADPLQNKPCKRLHRQVHGRDESLPYKLKIKAIQRRSCGPGIPGPYRAIKNAPILADGGTFYATLQITCTGRPAWSGARNGHRRQPGSSRTGPWRDPGRREPDGCNESRWPGSPDTWTYRRPWRSG